MKIATIILKLTKDHHITKHGVSPIEVLILAAEHNVNSKGDPVEVVKGSETEDKDKTEDAEISRLRLKYAPAKLAVLREFRELPKTFEDAIAKGKEVTMPGGLASQPKAAVISQTQLK